MKRKRLFRNSFLLIVILIVLYFVLPAHIIRYFIWNFADVGDYKKFPALEIEKGKSISPINKPYKNFTFEIPQQYKDTKSYTDFDDFLSDNKTLAFLVIKNDVLIYENYFDNYDSASIIPSFSVSKAFVSAMVGIAIDEGYIYSTSQSITFFLKELGPEFNAITIEDLLNMRSGISFDEGYSSPFADAAKYYYGEDLLEYIKHLNVYSAPDSLYDYVSVNTLLLGLIVERASNTKLSTYLEKKIWKPLGMEADASWSIDSEENQTIKSFCCINAVARDFVRFGQLYLQNGNWNGQQLVPEKWVNKSTKIINDSKDSQGYPYTYHWRVLENGSYFAKGILGQYIFVYPEKNLVFVRMGKNYADIDWVELFLLLSEEL